MKLVEAIIGFPVCLLVSALFFTKNIEQLERKKKLLKISRRSSKNLGIVFLLFAVAVFFAILYGFFYLEFLLTLSFVFFVAGAIYGVFSTVNRR